MFLADLLICQTFFCQMLKKSKSAKLFSYQTFALYGIIMGIHTYYSLSFHKSKAAKDGISKWLIPSLVKHAGISKWLIPSLVKHA